MVGKFRRERREQGELGFWVVPTLARVWLAQAASLVGVGWLADMG